MLAKLDNQPPAENGVIPVLYLSQVCLSPSTTICPNSKRLAGREHGVITCYLSNRAGFMLNKCNQEISNLAGALGKGYVQPFHLKIVIGTSLVAQWLRIHLPMQGTWVRSLLREDPTCRRATKPMSHNY